jgi:FtsZ-binding cell division protein ZapB
VLSSREEKRNITDAQDSLNLLNQNTELLREKFNTLSLSAQEVANCRMETQNEVNALKKNHELIQNALTVRLQIPHPHPKALRAPCKPGTAADHDVDLCVAIRPKKVTVSATWVCSYRF